MICKLGDFITQRHNELIDVETEFLSMVCSDVEIEPVLQDIFFLKKSKWIVLIEMKCFLIRLILFFD